MKISLEQKKQEDTIKIEELIDLIISRFKIEEILPQGADLIIGKRRMTPIFDGTKIPASAIERLSPDGADFKALQELIPDYIKNLKHTGDTYTPNPTEEEANLVLEKLDWIPVIHFKQANDLMNFKIKIKTEIIKYIEDQFRSSRLICYNTGLIPSTNFHEDKNIRKIDAVEIFKKFTRHIEKNSIPDEIRSPSEDINSKKEGWNFLCEKDYNYGSELRSALEHFHTKDPINPPKANDIIDFFKSQEHLNVKITKSGIEFKTINGPQIVSRRNLQKAITRRINNWKKQSAT